MHHHFLKLASFAFVIGTVASASNGCFRAAILDQVHQVERESLSKSIKLNFEVLESGAKLAKQNVKKNLFVHL